METKELKGRVKFLNGKGFGFIVVKEGEVEKDYFFHITGIVEGEVIKKDDRVSFTLEGTRKGPKAVNITKLEE